MEQYSLLTQQAMGSKISIPVTAQGGKVKWSQMPMYVVPSGPGRSRVLWWMCVDAQNLPRPMKLLAGLKPRWLEHLKTRNLVFEGDNIILHLQARTRFPGIGVCLTYSCRRVLVRWGPA